MSASIDSRVVEMRFDNKQFESAVSTSMSTLDKLKQKLNLSGASKGLSDLNTAAKNVNMSGLGGAVESVTAKFSALQVMGVTALANITNSAVNAGKNIVKSLTIDPVKSGFSEYETKMGSIQTILANTEHQGTTLDHVTAALDELNLYADKTIYNFQEMTRNIGTFTAAGVDLDTSVRSIQGIANLAAVSGSTSQQASTAMYQLSQALATGTVKLMDWNSVVNAGMGGKVFQNALIQTAAMLDGAAADVEAWQAKNIDAYGSFRDSLTQGEWLTSEVLTKTLEQFTMAAEEGSSEWEAFKKSLVDDGYTEAQAEGILKMANTATDAATKVKTFTQLMDTLKESAQSGWAQTWESIIGDFEEAKEFFTGLSDLFGGILGDSAERRNNLISGAMSSNWDKMIGKINEAGVETEAFEKSLENVVGKTKLDNLVTEFGSIEKVVKAGKISSDDLKKSISSLGKEAKESLNFSDIAEKVKGNKFLYSMGGLGKVSDEVKRIQTALNDLGYDISPDGKFGKATYQAVMAFQRAEGIKIDGIVGEETIAALEKATGKTGELTGEVNSLSGSCDDLIDGITKKSGRELLLDSLMNVIKAIHRPLAAVGEAMRNTFSVSPEQLYNALDAINKFTSKFVMKGVLDETTWDGLIAQVEKFGITESELSTKLSDTLKKNGIDVNDLKKKYGSLGEAFDKGAISIDHIKEALLNFDGISESLLLGGENADKLKRAFEGLFAAVKLVGTFVGGGLKFAFNVLTGILGAFDMNILDLAANMGDALVSFQKWVTEGNLIAQMFDSLLAKLPGIVENVKAWFNAFKQTPAVQKLVTAIEAIQSAFDKLMSGDINVSEFAASLGTNLANALKSLPEIAVQIASDFIAGFIGGLGSGISDAIGTIVEAASSFVAAFAAALGVQSPSWKAFEIAVDFIKGFINGIGGMIGKAVDIIKTVGNKLVDIFKDLWDSITDESGNIQWGKIVSAGIITAVLWILKTFATAFKGIADAFGSLDDIFENTAKAIKSFKKVLDGYAWDLKASAMQKMAIAIAILVASIWVLTTIDDVGKLWNAVGVLLALAGILALLAFAMSRLSDASVSFDKGKLDIKGIQTSLLQIGIVIFLLAAAVKMIGTMELGQAVQGFVTLAAIAGALYLFMLGLSKLPTGDGNIVKLGNLMIKLSIAMMLMIGVCKMVDSLSAEEILGGVAFAAAFAIFVRTITAVAKSAGNNIGKVGGMMVKLAIAMGLMVGVVKLASMLSPKEMFKGVIFAAGFTAFVWALVKCTKIGKKQQIAKLGGLILSISVSMALLVGVCKLVGRLSAEELIKGAAFAVGFGIFLKALVKALTIGNEQQLAKVAGVVLALSIAIGILAGVAFLLGLLDIGSLAKGITAVVILSGMMALMAKSLKGAQNAKGAIMMMAICIGVMAAAVVALSFIPFEDLAPAVIGMSLLMGAFSLMLKGLKGLKGVQIGPIIALTIVVAALAGVIYLLKGLDPLSSIGNVIALSALMLAMSVTLKILNTVSGTFTGALKGILALTLMAVPLLALVGVLHLMSGVENATSNAMALIGLATTLALLLIPLTIIGAIATTGVGALAIGLGIGALLLMAVPLLALIGVLKLMSGVENATTNAALLIDLVTVLSDVLVKLSLVAPLAVMGVGAMAGLILLIGSIGLMAVAVGALMDKFPSIQKFLDSGLPVLEQLANSIGTMIGNFIGGIGEGLGDSLVQIGEDIAAFMDALAKASDNASGIDGSAFDGVKQLIGALAGIGLTSVGTTITDVFTSLFSGQTSMEKFQNDAVAFFDAMKAISEASTGVTINEEGLDAIIGVAEKLAGIQSSLNPIGGVVSWFAGRSDLATFGDNIGAFIESMKIALSSLEGYVPNTAALDPMISAATSLADLQSVLEPIGGVISWFSGRDDLATFGTNIGVFIESMKTALSTLEGATLDEAALGSIINAATKLSELQSSLEPIGGVVSWFAGRDDLGSFGENIATFATAMGTLKTQMGETGISEDTVASVSNAGNAIIALQAALPEEGWFDGKMDLDTFAGYVTDFATAMGTFATETAGMDPASIDVAINAANRIKTLITSLAGLDASGLASFAGVGLGDGHLVNMGQAIAKYGEAVAELNVDAVNTSVSAAVGIKNLIASLVGLDTSGIENFKIGSIGTAMKDYAANVADLDPSIVSASISAANRLKTFIVGLAGIDASGIANFNPRPIGSAMQSYATSVGGIDPAIVSASISAATRLKSFISSLAGFDSSGVAAFKTAVTQLSTVDLDGLVSTFAGKADALRNSASDIINAMANGLTGGKGTVINAMKTIADGVVTEAESISSELRTVGATYASNIAEGISSGAEDAAAAGESIGNEAASGAGDERIQHQMVSAGRFIAGGLVGGVLSKIINAWLAGFELGQAAVRGANAGADVNSPSKLTLETGKSLGEGLVLGMERMGNAVYKTGVHMSQDAVDGISTSISRISDAINSDIDAQPTIRPVLDLSDVRAGASSIAGMLDSSPVGLMTNIGAVSAMMNRRNQNGAESEVVSAITKLRRDLANMPRESYQIGNVTYDDGSNIKNFAQAVVRQATLERRV